ncbi:hypothetical protein ACJX0J_025530, partial [Zea mays]
PQLGISPATPDIVRKLARPSGTTTAVGYCCTALYTSTAAGPGKVDGDGLASVPLHAHEHSQSAALDNLVQVDCDPVGTQESSTLPALVGESSGKVAQQEQQHKEGVDSARDAGAASPAPTSTPENMEPTPRRRGKKSTKGVQRLKVAKDKVMKLKVTTPSTVKKKKMTEDDIQHIGAHRSNSARRKLDLDLHSSESKTCFSRAELMINLKCIGKSYGLISELTTHKRSKRGKKRKMMVGNKESGQLALLPYNWTTTVAVSRPLTHVKKLRAKVLGLTDETMRVCAVLANWNGSDNESFEGFDIGNGPEWDTTRQMFEQFVDIFINAMFDLIGPRKYSQWGGSLIDSVVGTFLTQNSADNLSSQAFMNIAAKFPKSERHCQDNATQLIDGVDRKMKSKEAFDNFDLVHSHFDEYIKSEEEVDFDKKVKSQYGEDYNRIIGNFAASMKQKNISTWDSDLMNLVKDKYGNPVCDENNLRKILASLRQPVTASNWKELQEEAYKKGYNNKSQTETSDVVDWESVLNAPFSEVAKCIAIRGQHNILAVRILAFLDHVKKAQDGSFDLDWLRFVSREKAKKFLLSIHGIGVKSADCICLLSLRHRAFPVDVNVARIVTRLGWVKLQPLNGADFHLIDLYPILDDVQRYLWPRLCTIDKEKLYELHCLMITFGKVVCRKKNPNCGACPFSASCKYYNSSLAKKSLPLPEKHEQGEQQTSMVAYGSCTPSSQQMYRYQIAISSTTTETPPIHSCEPIVEMPPSPEYEYNETPNEQEDFYEDYACDIEDFAPGVQYDSEINICSNKHTLNNNSWTPNCGKDLAVINPKCSFGQSKKLKNTGRLRTEHNAYVLPDGHVILEEFEDRVPGDRCPYLLVVISCPDDYKVKGTVLIPCRTANRGKFPLNGTYFQENEVFADYSSSRNPITVPRECIGMLERSIVYFGSSIHSITKGQTRQDIQECLKE